MIRDLTLADALTVCSDMRQEDASCVRAVMGEEPGEWYAVDRFQTRGPAWALLQDGQPWAIGGMTTRGWSGLLWMVARPGLTGQSWRKVLRLARTMLSVASDPVSPQYLHRIEAHVLGGWGGAERFAGRLGRLRFEGTRRAAGSRGEDVHIWAWTGPVKE